MPHPRRSVLVSLIAAICLVLSTAAASAKAQKVEDAIWHDGELYDTVVTPTSFMQPPSHAVDLIFSFAMSGLMGQRSVSESAPGEPDYNGGKWWVQMVVFTEAGLAALDPGADSTIDVELKSVEEVLQAESDGYLTITPTSTYFQCPMLRGDD